MHLHGIIWRFYSISKYKTNGQSYKLWTKWWNLPYTTERPVSWIYRKRLCLKAQIVMTERVRSTTYTKRIRLSIRWSFCSLCSVCFSIILLSFARHSYGSDDDISNLPPMVIRVLLTLEIVDKNKHTRFCLGWISTHEVTTCKEKTHHNLIHFLFYKHIITFLTGSGSIVTLWPGDNFSNGLNGLGWSKTNSFQMNHFVWYLWITVIIRYTPEIMNSLVLVN